MQTSVLSREADLIPFLICCCLISILAWNVFLISSNFPWTLSIRETTASRGSTKNCSNFMQLPRHFQPEGDQLLGQNIVENECNYAEFVPAARVDNSIYDFQLRVRKLAAVDNDVDKSLPEEVFKDEHKFLPTTSESNLEDSQEIGNAPGTIHETAIARGIEKETQMEGFLNERPIDGITVRMNAEDAVKEAECETLEETNNAEQSIHRETSLKGAVAFEESPAMLLSTGADQFERKFANDEAALEENWYKSRGEREEYARNAYDRKNGVDTPADDNEDDPRHKFGAHLQIEEGDSKENADEYSAELKMKIEGRPEMGASSSSTENFLISILQDSIFQESNKNEMKRNKRSGEKIITLEACPSKDTVYSPENELMKKENCGMSSCEGEGSKMAFDRFEERLRVDADICLKEHDYLEQFGMIPEEGANCTEEKSIMHSGKNTTQPQDEEKEKELGLLPAVELLKNCRDAECTISLARPVDMSHGKEEEGLNVLIRRMIVTELKKYRKKERATLKRTYSDTEIVLPRKSSSARNRAGLLNLKDRTFFQDLLELEESPHKRCEEKSDSESTDNVFDEIRVRRDDSRNENVNPSRNDNDAVTAIETSNDIEKRIDSSSVTCVTNSNILLERKVNVHCLVDVEEEKPTDAGKSLAARIPKYASKSTQTEHVYVIRTVRSCPLRKRRLPLQMQLQLHRLPLDRETVSSKTVYASRDFTEYIFRKASDNLIYEKGKGSRCPSYVPSPERFRWRYLTPNEVTQKII